MSNLEQGTVPLANSERRIVYDVNLGKWRMVGFGGPRNDAQKSEPQARDYKKAYAKEKLERQKRKQDWLQIAAADRQKLEQEKQQIAEIRKEPVKHPQNNVGEQISKVNWLKPYAPGQQPLAVRTIDEGGEQTSEISRAKRIEKDYHG